MGAKEQSGRTWPSIFWARGTVSVRLIVNNVSYKGKVEIVKAAKMEENTEEVIKKGEENGEEIVKSDSPPSPPRARKLSRRSSVAIARRLSRASAAGVISLEEQLEIVPARDEAPTDARLTQVSERLKS